MRPDDPGTPLRQVFRLRGTKNTLHDCHRGRQRVPAAFVGPPRIAYQLQPPTLLQKLPHLLGERPPVAMNRGRRACLGCARLGQLAAVHAELFNRKFVAGDDDCSFADSRLGLANVVWLIETDAEGPLLFLRRELPVSRGVLLTIFWATLERRFFATPPPPSARFSARRRRPPRAS